MRRREFIRVLGGAITLAPFDARAQQPGKVHRVAVIVRAGQGTDLTESADTPHWRAWRDELQRLGYVEGKNLAIDRRSGGSDPKQIRELVREALGFKPDVIFAPAQNMAEAVKAAVVTIPTVVIVADPLGSGLVANLARPGGNITGFSIDAGMETLPKRFALLREVVPGISRIAYLAARAILEGKFGALGRDAARQMGMSMIDASLDAPVNDAEYRRAFAAMVRDRADSLYVSASAENLPHRHLIGELALAARLPSVSFYRENAEAGALMAYGPDIVDLFRRAAGYIDRILKGANPAEMPFQQPSRFELVVNLKTAKALGLVVPAPLLARADEVIE